MIDYCNDWLNLPSSSNEIPSLENADNVEGLPLHQGIRSNRARRAGADNSHSAYLLGHIDVLKFVEEVTKTNPNVLRWISRRASHFMNTPLNG